MSQFFLGWIYWDPSPTAFTLPYFDLAIAWYGILFALGFVVGYFLLLPMFRRLIWQSQRLYPRDIANWQLLINVLRSGNDIAIEVLNKLSKQALHTLKALPEKADPPTELKQALIVAFTLTLQDSHLKINRQMLETAFPGGITPAKALSVTFTDHLTWFVVLGTIVGARLGHVFFYDWPYFQNHLTEIFMVRQGGLSSHGGTLGVIISLILFLRFHRKEIPELNLVKLIDLLVVPTAFVAFCIRLGNFMNQEIVGTPTQVPWAVVFGHPVDGIAGIPLHPTQMYEGVLYLATFAILYTLWKKFPLLKAGFLSGLFFLLVFGGRFLLEFIKAPQTVMIDESFLNTGQYLSIPFIILGAALLYRSCRR